MFCVAGPTAMLTIQPPVVIEGQTAQSCLSFSRLERLSEPINITLSTVSSIATGDSNVIGCVF